ncbi:SusC/RagA family TonB-linked outer membrane protein [Sphingobacterium pedocola]|jgi:TonB-linked SusC/RagA family outer membrane protein|uniref:SusC/RagA family TonB-linked outer membrane protein n=1 Tax=Sphingobacterium pedocola TaxID=2082722 RepID=A0ABR9T1Y8_9SPHI|nr:TonB-dependent receptor [Sphingobacterium pedocola]MBE8719357.1 SusC/RagA family TonB-linked outer membrane protein [Sphingobacterium pedocola]
MKTKSTCLSSLFKKTVTCLIFFLVSSQIWATTRAQTFSFKKDQASIAEILQEIQKQTDYSFMYNSEDLKNFRRQNVNFRNTKIELVLQHVFDQAAIEYNIKDNLITLYKRKSTLKAIERQDTVVLRGKVVNPDNIPLEGVSIQLKDVKKQTSTNKDGDYFIETGRLNGVLVFSYVGYKELEIPITNSPIINITLSPDSSSLDEVVVVGYGTQKKITSIGAQSSIRPADLKQPVGSLSSVIAGRVAGVIGVQRSGEPGYDASNIYIRGISTFTSSSPLVLVDGVERSFNNIDPEDIANFTILKDASATAVYGMRGANGVILIETKRGNAGKAKVNVQYNQGITQFTKVPEFADGVTYLQMANEAYANSYPGRLPLYSEEKIQNTVNGIDPDLNPNIDWFGEMFNDFGQNRRANVNMNGGTERAKYYLSVGYYDENGLYKTDELAQYNSKIKFTRLNFTSNLNMILFKDTKVDFGAMGFVTNGNYPGTSAGDIWDAAFIMPPTIIPVRYSNGHIAMPRGEVRNPYEMLTQSGYVNNINSQLWSNIRVTQPLDFMLKGLSVYGMFSFDNYNAHQISRTKTVDTHFATHRDNNGELVFEQTRIGSSYLGYGRTNGGNRQLYMESGLNYQKIFGKHDVTGMLLYNQRDFVDAFAGDFISSIPSRLQGVVSRFTYAYDDRYLAEFNIGYNGAENFKEGSRFGFFPSYGLGWVVSNEPFFEQASRYVQLLKARASYGVVGNSNIGGRRFGYLATVMGATGYSFGQTTNNSFNGLDIGDYPIDVSWEEAKKANFGIELKTLGGGLSVIADYFLENREGIFLQRGDLPNYTGIRNRPYGNLGAIFNHGIDGTVEFSKAVGQDLFLQFRGNMVWNRATIKEDSNALWPYPWQQRIGRKFGQRFGKIALGLFQSEEEIANSPQQTGDIQPGDIKYRDLNGDGRIDSYDEAPIGYGSMPEIVYGFGPSVTYKNWSFGLWFKGISNVDISTNGEGMQPFQKEGARGNLFSDIVDRWTPETNPSNPTYPRLTYPSTSNSNYENSSWWINNGAFLRLQNVEVSYTFKDKGWMNKIGLQNFRIYGIGYNLATFSSFKLWDVELGDGKGAMYPLVKTYNIGIDCRF